eukprot:Gb_29589 [translate_table: standard]
MVVQTSYAVMTIGPHFQCCLNAGLRRVESCSCRLSGICFQQKSSAFCNISCYTVAVLKTMP